MSTPHRQGNGDSERKTQASAGQETGKEHAAIVPPADMREFDELEQQIASQLEKEFGDRDKPVEIEPAAAAVQGPEISSRLLEIRRKRDLSASLEEQIREGAGLFSSLAKQVGSLSVYLDKTEAELRRLERIEATSTKLRIASEGIVRNNHEMKATIEEQRKKITLLESKIMSLREANEAARTNLARLIEEKRVSSVDLTAMQADIARLENDRRSMAERVDRSDEEVRELQSDLGRSKEREKAMSVDIRRLEDDLARKTSEIEELREVRTQSSMQIEELKSRNATLESKTVEQRSRIEELTFEMKSGRKEMEEIIRLKQQRILELEARGVDQKDGRRSLGEAQTPSIALEDPAEDDTAPAPKTAKSHAKSETGKSETKQAAKPQAKQTVKSN